MQTRMTILQMVDFGRKNVYQFNGSYKHESSVLVEYKIRSAFYDLD